MVKKPVEKANNNLNGNRKKRYIYEYQFRTSINPYWVMTMCVTMILVEKCFIFVRNMLAFKNCLNFVKRQEVLFLYFALECWINYYFMPKKGLCAYRMKSLVIGKGKFKVTSVLILWELENWSPKAKNKPWVAYS